MKDPTYENRLLMPHELARVLGVSVNWVRTHAAPSSKHRIPVKKVGNLLRFDLSEVLAWIDSQQEGQVLHLIRAEREGLKYRLCLLRMRKSLLGRMGPEFDPVLSQKLDCIDFLLRDQS